MRRTGKRQRPNFTDFRIMNRRTALSVNTGKIIEPQCDMEATLQKALYYPHTDITNEAIIKNALLLWDQVETIIPSETWRPEMGTTTDLGPLRQSGFAKRSKSWLNVAFRALKNASLHMKL